MAKLFAWKRICVCVCSEVQALPTLLSTGEAERLLPPPSLLAALFGVFLRGLCPVPPSLTFIVSFSERFVHTRLIFTPTTEFIGIFVDFVK